MSNVSLNHVEKALDKIRVIFLEAEARIEKIAPGEKIPATKLAEDLAKDHGMTGASFYPTLKFLLQDYPGVSVQRGAHGGIIRPKVVTDATPPAADSSNPSNDK